MLGNVGEMVFTLLIKYKWWLFVDPTYSIFALAFVIA
jgi:Co/Zn/Cd efflux system component